MTLAGGFFQDSLLELFLALDTVAGPGNRLKPLGIDVLAAGDALAEGTFPDPGERALNHLQQLAVGIALVEQELFVVRAGSFVGDILRHILVRCSAVLLCARDHAAQLLLPGLQTLLESF